MASASAIVLSQALSTCALAPVATPFNFSRALPTSRKASCRGATLAAPVSRHARKRFSVAASESAETVMEEEVEEEVEATVAVEAIPEEPGSKLGDSVEGKQRLLLKFIWMDKNIGITVDQVIPNKGTVPLSPFFFWPRKDAWEELKVVLESKPWLPRRRTIILLNQATDIINLWQSQAYKQQ